MPPFSAGTGIGNVVKKKYLTGMILHCNIQYGDAYGEFCKEILLI